LPEEDRMEILKPSDANCLAASAPMPVPAAVKIATLFLFINLSYPQLRGKLRC